MSTTLSPDAIKVAISEAFKPFRCGVEIFDYETRIRFKVFGPKGVILLYAEETVLDQISTPLQFRDFVGRARTNLTTRHRELGLDAWISPFES